jgi:hypothetical protein
MPTDKQADQRIDVVGGVDTHKDMHMAAVITAAGVVLGTEAFSTTRAGYRAMLHWMRSHGELLRVGSNRPAASAQGSAAIWRSLVCRCSR